MKFLTISDIHGRHNRLDFSKYKDIDTIICTGDFTRSRIHYEEDFIEFVNWFANTPFKNKILISGNHDKYMQFHRHEGLILLKELGIIYLEDSNVVLDGIKIHGSPWTPPFFNWFFMAEEYELNNLYNKVDPDTQVLLTHGPANHVLDRTFGGVNAGSTALRDLVFRLDNLKVHVFGHIHEARGELDFRGIKFINASLLNTTDFFTFELPSN